jgi:hypothetical protein
MDLDKSFSNKAQQDFLLVERAKVAMKKLCRANETLPKTGISHGFENGT